MKVYTCNDTYVYSQNHNNVLFCRGCVHTPYLLVEVSLSEEKTEHHCLKVLHQIVAEIVKLCQQNVVESLTVLSHLLSFLLLQVGATSGI